MLVAVCVILIFLAAISRGIRINLDASIDFFENNGSFVVKAGGVAVFKGELRLVHTDLLTNNLIIKSGKRQTEVHLNVDPNDKQSVLTILRSPLLGNLDLKSACMDARVGKSDDALFTAVTIAAMRFAFASVISFIKCRQLVYARESFVPVFDKNEFKASIQGIFFISIADIIDGTIRSIRLNKGFKNDYSKR